METESKKQSLYRHIASTGIFYILTLNMSEWIST